MTTVNSTGSSSTTGTTSVAKSSMADYQTFLKLLVTQMQNQDPTEPMDNTEYMAQLASFSNVEQNVQINNKLDELLKYSQLSQGADLIGKTVTSLDGETSGVVQQVMLVDDKVVAMLEDGTAMYIDSNVAISA